MGEPSAHNGGGAGGGSLPQCGGSVDLLNGAAGGHGGEDPPGVHVAAPEEDALEELRPLAHAQGAHHAAQVGRVHGDADVSGQEGAARLVGDVGHVGVAGPVQHEVGQLGVTGGAQHFSGLPGGGLEDARQTTQVAGTELFRQLLHLHPPGGHQQPLGVRAHGLGLEQGLDVVVVVFDLENLQNLRMRGGGGEILQRLVPLLGQHPVQLIQIHSGHVGPAALGEDLDRVLRRSGLQHALQPLAVEEIALHGLDAGGEEEVVGVFDFWQAVIPPFERK